MPKLTVQCSPTIDILEESAINLADYIINDVITQIDPNTHEITGSAESIQKAIYKFEPYLDIPEYETIPERNREIFDRLDYIEGSLKEDADRIYKLYKEISKQQTMISTMKNAIALTI